jgi:maltose O-acetyltransferase
MCGSQLARPEVERMYVEDTNATGSLYRRENNASNIAHLLTHQSPLHTLAFIRSVLWAKWKLRKATSIGKYVKLVGQMRVVNQGRLIVEDRVLFNSYLGTSQLVVKEGAELTIGRGAFVNYGADFCALKRITIGEECRIGTYCIIMDSDFHEIELERRQQRPAPAEVVLEPHTWIGNRVTILKGVRIGYGSVVAAGSVVTRSVPRMSVVGGVPARIIRRIGEPAGEEIRHDGA